MEGAAADRGDHLAAGRWRRLQRAPLRRPLARHDVLRRASRAIRTRGPRSGPSLQRRRLDAHDGAVAEEDQRVQRSARDGSDGRWEWQDDGLAQQRAASRLRDEVGPAVHGEKG